MLNNLLRRVGAWLRGLLGPSPVRLTVVRRYGDANGAYVGELYIDGMMVGVSLDTLPLRPCAGGTALRDFSLETGGLTLRDFVLDTGSDFLAYMPPHTLRVGAPSPADNDAVRSMVGRLPRRRMTLEVHNRFVERVAGT